MVGILTTLPIDLGDRGRGTFETDELDLYLADMPGLVHAVFPEDFIGKNTALSRAGGDTDLWSWIGTPSAIEVVEEHAAFNNLPVFNYLSAAAQFKGPLGSPTESYTLVWVTAIDAARRAGSVSSYLVGTYNGAINPDTGIAYGGEVAVQWAMGASIFQHTPETNTSGNPLNVNINLMPAGDVAAIICVSYDSTPPAFSQTSRIYVNDFLNPVGTRDIHSQKPRVGPQTRWTLGGNEFSLDLNFVGEIGLFLVFNQPYHTTPALQDRMQGLFEILIERFNISVAS